VQNELIDSASGLTDTWIVGPHLFLSDILEVQIHGKANRTGCFDHQTPLDWC
jgi:hypothetical protein